MWLWPNYLITLLNDCFFAIVFLTALLSLLLLILLLSRVVLLMYLKCLISLWFYARERWNFTQVCYSRPAQMSRRNNQNLNHNATIQFFTCNFTSQFINAMVVTIKETRAVKCVFLTPRLRPADWPCRWIIWKRVPCPRFCADCHQSVDNSMYEPTVRQRRLSNTR